VKYQQRPQAHDGSLAQKHQGSRVPAQDWAQVSAGTTVKAAPATRGWGEWADAEAAAAGAGVQHGHSSSYEQLPQASMQPASRRHV